MTRKQIEKFNALIDEEQEIQEVLDALENKEEEIAKQLEVAYKQLHELQDKITAQCEKFGLPSSQEKIETA